MIYTIYFQLLGRSFPVPINPYMPRGEVNLMTPHTGKNLSLWQYLARKIKASKDDTYVFITTKNQSPLFEQFLQEGELKDFIVRDTPQFITNTNYPDQGRKLRLTIMQSKDHPQRKES